MSSGLSVSNMTSLYNQISNAKITNYGKNTVKGTSGTSSTSSVSGLTYTNGVYVNSTTAALMNTSAFSSENASNLKALSKAATALSSAASKLGTQSLQSSDTAVATSSAKFTGVTGAKSYDVNVTQLATGQTSKSAELTASERSGFATGTNSINVTVGGKTSNLSFNVSSTDSNQTVLGKIASSINKSGIGITASVTTKGGKSTLSIASDSTGAASTFSIASSSGNAAEKLGLTVTQAAQDAKYSVNGKDYTSSSNTASLPYGAGTLTLKGTGEAKLSSQTDSSSLIDAASEFVTAYNKSIKLLNSKTGAGAGVNTAIGMISNKGLSALSSIGITKSSDGTLSLDSKKLDSAVQSTPGTVKSALSGSFSSVSKVASGAQQASRLPTASYTDFSNAAVSSSLISMLMPSSGSLFDLLL